MNITTEHRILLESTHLTNATGISTSWLISIAANSCKCASSCSLQGYIFVTCVLRNGRGELAQLTDEGLAGRRGFKLLKSDGNKTAILGSSLDGLRD